MELYRLNLGNLGKCILSTRDVFLFNFVDSQILISTQQHFLKSDTNIIMQVYEIILKVVFIFEHIVAGLFFRIT